MLRNFATRCPTNCYIGSCVFALIYRQHPVPPTTCRWSRRMWWMESNEPGDNSWTDLNPKTFQPWVWQQTHIETRPKPFRMVDRPQEYKQPKGQQITTYFWNFPDSPCKPSMNTVFLPKQDSIQTRSTQKLVLAP